MWTSNTLALVSLLLQCLSWPPFSAYPIEYWCSILACFPPFSASHRIPTGWVCLILKGFVWLLWNVQDSGPVRVNWSHPIQVWLVQGASWAAVQQVEHKADNNGAADISPHWSSTPHLVLHHPCQTLCLAALIWLLQMTCEQMAREEISCRENGLLLSLQPIKLKKQKLSYKVNPPRNRTSHSLCSQTKHHIYDTTLSISLIAF